MFNLWVLCYNLIMLFDISKKKDVIAHLNQGRTYEEISQILGTDLSLIKEWDKERSSVELGTVAQVASILDAIKYDVANDKESIEEKKDFINRATLAAAQRLTNFLLREDITDGAMSIVVKNHAATIKLLRDLISDTEQKSNNDMSLWIATNSKE